MSGEARPRWYRHPAVSWRSLFFAYPFGVYLLSRAHLTAVAIALALCGALMHVDFRSQRRLLAQILFVAAVVPVVLALHPAALPRVYPFLISVSFFTVFWRSLSMEESMLEVYAGKVKILTAADRVALRRLTKWWVVFLALNSLALLALVFWFSLETWMLYSGVIFYVLMGVMVGLTTLIAKRWATAFCLPLALAAVPARVDAAASLEEQLKRHYGVITEMTADIVQTRTSPHLFKPLVSKVKLKYTPSVITWTVTEPVASVVTLTKDGMTIAAGGTAQALPMAQNPKAQAMMTLIRSLFSLDFPAIERGYAVDAADLTLHAKGKQDAGDQLIQELTFQFAPDLTPLELALKTATDTTDLVFSHVQVVQKRP